LNQSFQGQTYESNVPYVLRYMIDQEVQGCNWLELPRSTYRVRQAGELTGRCSLEVDVVYTNVISHPSTGNPPYLFPCCIKFFYLIA